MNVYESYVEKIIWGYKTSDKSVLGAVTDISIGYIKKFLQCNICPFCGKVYKNRMSLRFHLIHNSVCRDLYKSSIKYTVDVYVMLRRYIVRLSTPKRNGVALDLPSRARIKFRNKQELAEWIRSHKDEIISLFPMV